jgi:hypothetical protein
MGHRVALSARGMNFIGDEGNTPVEFPDRVYNHDSLYAAQPGLSIPCTDQRRLKRPAGRALFVEGSDTFFGLAGFARFHVMPQRHFDVLAD